MQLINASSHLSCHFYHLLIGAVLLLTSLLQAQPKVVAYVPNWIDVAAFSETIDYAKLTHINIAFENPDR